MCLFSQWRNEKNKSFRHRHQLPILLHFIILFVLPYLHQIWGRRQLQALVFIHSCAFSSIALYLDSEKVDEEGKSTLNKDLCFKRMARAHIQDLDEQMGCFRQILTYLSWIHWPFICGRACWISLNNQCFGSCIRN